MPGVLVRRIARTHRTSLLNTLALVALAMSSALAAAQSPVERGRYLVETILACGNCHTPKDANGQPIRDRNLSGGLEFDIPPFAGVASNITPDRETGIGAWSDDEIRRAITHAERPRHGRLAGVPLAPVMASGFFKALTPSDLDAVVAYLRSVPPVRNAIALPTYRMQVPHERYPDAERGFTAADMSDKVRRGAYLATIAHCMECHTPAEKGRTLYETSLGAGGKQFMPGMVKGLPATWSGATARNITSHPQAGLGRWSDAEIKRAITHAVSRDGRKLQPPMGYAWYAGLRDDDLDAIVAYLRTVPAKP